ncbi:hypothetical protein [Methylocystis sp.]|uniref:hypothetical protein n=1 Tax=Methylocystis sp. TaxID=1911079 RepID=UPI003D100F1C
MVGGDAHGGAVGFLGAEAVGDGGVVGREIGGDEALGEARNRRDCSVELRGKLLDTEDGGAGVLALLGRVRGFGAELRLLLRVRWDWLGDAQRAIDYARVF